MTQLSVVPPDGGEILQLGPIQMRILEDGRTTGHRLGLGVITIPPGASGPPQHRHAEHDEGFYVVSGTPRFTAADTTYMAAPGTLVMVPPGVPHTFANPGDEPAVLLNTFTPDMYVPYFRDVQQLLADGRPLTGADAARLMSKYATTTADETGDGTRTVYLHPDLPITLTETGSGRPVLILHGGGGPVTVQGIAAHLSGSHRVLVPVHPGWNGTPRPEWLGTVGELRAAYLELLKDEGLRDVLVIGSSMGGWIAADMAARDQDGLISGVVLIDAGGVMIEGQPMVDFFSLDARGIAEHAWHDPDRFYVDPATLPPAAVAQQAANMATMRVLTSDPYDPGLLARVGQVRVPALVLWGDSDRVYTPEYGRAYAAAFGNASYTLIEDAGHLPHIEQPAATFAALDQFLTDQR